MIKLIVRLKACPPTTFLFVDHELKEVCVFNVQGLHILPQMLSLIAQQTQYKTKDAIGLLPGEGYREAGRAPGRHEDNQVRAELKNLLERSFR